jgi:peptide chain release factor subunit 1
VLIPPEPLSAYCYFSDDHFHLEPLREMVRDPKIVGVLALDAKQASFGLLKGERVELMETISSGVSGKTGKGGQSQRRYERKRDMELTYFFHRIAEHAARAFLENHVNVLLTGGPGQTKNDFLKGPYLHYELSNMLLNTVDTQSAEGAALREIYAKSAELLGNMCGPEERKLIERFSAELAKQSGLATYGLDSVLDALIRGEVQVALVTDDACALEVVAVCRNCGYPKKAITHSKAQTVDEMTRMPCEKCGAISYEFRERDIVDVFEDMAAQKDSAVEVISSASKEKDQLTALGGFAALLRYKKG